MTFVTNHHDYQHYFTTAKADFQAAVQPFTKRAGMFSVCIITIMNTERPKEILSIGGELFLHPQSYCSK